MNLRQESYNVRHIAHYLNVVETNKHYIIVSTLSEQEIVRKNDKNILECFYQSGDKTPESLAETYTRFTDIIQQFKKKETAWKELSQKTDVINVSYDEQKALRLKKMFNK